MPRPSATGRPGSTVIHRHLEAAVASVANRAHTATVAIESPGVASFSAVTNRSTATPVVEWSGTARVQALEAQPGESSTAGDEVPSRRYLVQVESDAVASIGWQVRVVTCTDALLVGRKLMIGDLTLGSVRAQRDLICTLVGV